ncbi:extracellular solute-binding protein [Nocardioides kongjuensis]|uniref:Multiple sugar transport system substrate-binding protein n=1 Tax=Nocardioides kongjuensis TaxID=349522 RepID=A0A852S078_9ACTN|nr:extracellular solute-binding protein [Nocardioides kongjuensis]NYD33504.1 multiple sugar transport system substrate-binding protein [Nocardioides kongjuensis]
MRSTNDPRGRRSRHRRRAALAAVAALAAGSLTACGGSGKPTLNWYVNPDGVDTFQKYAKSCSTDQYDIAVQLLPNGATDQRTQLARRLAAEDSSTDLMNLDPVFVAEFANAGWLQEVEGDLADSITSSVEGDGDYLSGAAETVTWDDKVFAIPLWANTQVLWYRKSLAQAAGLDMTQPVTWDQVIKAAADHDGTVGVQANKYEAYVVWINALVQGAGGDIVSDTEAGRDAKVDIGSDAGRKAAEIIKELADSKAAQPDFTVSNEGTSLGQMFPESGAGEFMVNWTFVYKNYEGQVGSGLTDEQFADLGWARYPATVEGEASKPPIGGIDIGVGAYSEHPDFAMEAARCITSEQAQVDLALDNGLMPSTNAAYDKVSASGDYPADLIELFRTSVDEGGPRPKSAFYAMISGAIQARWHSPTSVEPGSTPKDSATYLEDVLEGKSLL